MKYFLLVFSLFLLYGCSIKVDTNTLAIDKNTIQKEYYTYDAKEGKISAYFFSNHEGSLHVNSYVTYIPFDTNGVLYSPFSPITRTLNKYAKAPNMEEALLIDTQRNNQTKLFHDKEEYILSRDFAFELIQEIQTYNQKMDRDDRNDDDSGSGGVIIVP